MKGLLIGLAVALAAAVLIVAAYLAGLFPASTPEKPPASEETGSTDQPVEETEESAPEPEVISVTVRGDEYSFSPSAITVPRGSVVRLTFMNTGTTSHDFVIASLGLSTPLVSPGQSATLEFTAPDSSITFQAICSVPGHKEFGMVGTLVVE